MIIPMKYKLGDVLLGDLTNGMFISSGKVPFYKSTLGINSESDLKSYSGNETVELSTDEFNALTATYFALLPERFKTVTKHMAGMHDQSTHAGGKHVAGVPDHIDLEGKRYNIASIRELDKRAKEAQAAFDAAKDKVVFSVYGKHYNELLYTQRWDVDNNRLTTFSDNGSDTKAFDYNKEASQDPAYLAANKLLEEHFLYKDAMSQLAYNADGTRGPQTIGELQGFRPPREKMLAYASLYDEWDGKTIATPEPDSKPMSWNEERRDASGHTIFMDASAKVPVTMTMGEAREIAKTEWDKFVANGNPVYIVSNKGLGSILKDGRAKTYAEVDRPKRAGINDESYKNDRATYESNAFGYKETDDPAIRPISAFYSGTKEIHPDLLNGYGGTQLILKRDVLGRSTATDGDSLNRWEIPSTVEHYFSKGGPSTSGMLQRIAGETKVNGGFWNHQTSSGSLPELQIHGGLKVSDIASVVFQDKAPVNVVSKLDKLGIPYEVIPKVENKW